MSDKSLIIRVAINEKQLVEAVDAMCKESLPPDTYTKWGEVMAALIAVRDGLKP